ncbi:MAG: ComEA family DNA-binding protein [Actinomycetota bacterium]|nr:ComEA family DNA-binding protein [Actinomycetota bacterium]
MPELSRAQLAVYAALAVVALLLGSRWIRGGGEAGSASDGSLPVFDSAVSEGSESAAEPGTFEPTDGDLVVHVAGAVREPGVFQMPPGSRVTDAIGRAGGTTADAAPDSINLAAPLADGQQIQVPAKAADGATAGATSASGTDGPISLGSATAEELDTIEGIGPVTAAAILEFRDQNGGISSVDDLDQVSGIGPATMEALRARLQP